MSGSRNNRLKYAIALVSVILTVPAPAQDRGAPPGPNVSLPEKVDAYEIGAKTASEDRFPGIFNLAAYYHDFRDQQLQQGVLTSNGTLSTSDESTAIRIRRTADPVTSWRPRA